MHALLKWFVILTPIELVGIAAGGVYLHGAVLIAAVIAAFGAIQFVVGNWQLSSMGRWVWPFLAFLVVSGWSLATSPYLGAAGPKGMAQILGVSALLLCAVTFAQVASRDGKLLLTLIRFSSMSLGVVGLIGIAQFAVNSAANDTVVNLAILNPYLGVPWLNPGNMGRLYRASSLTTEAAHMATFLTAGLGLALVRFGLLGGVGRSREIAYIMPTWAAVGIVGALAVSLSLVGYLGGIMALVATRWLGRRFRSPKLKKRHGRRAYMPLAAGGALIALLLAVSGQAILDKVRTTTLISGASALAEEGTVRDFIITENVSALAIAINLEITQKNFLERPMLGAGIGAHPATYNDKAPEYAFLSPIVLGLNQEDAASLLFRLISETGWLGTGAFLIGLLLVFHDGWKATRRSMRATELDPEYAVLGAIAAGLTASAATITSLYLLRMGIYFAAPFWSSVAFAVAFAMLVSRVLPQVAARRTYAVPRPSPVESPAE